MKTILSKMSEILVGDQELTKDKRRFISLLLIITATILAWRPHQRTVTFLYFWSKTSKTEGFIPDFVTAILGLLIVLPLYFRNILKWEKTSIYSILSFITNLTLIATFCKIILGEGFIFSGLTISLGMSLILTWLGMRPIAGVAWVAVFIIGVVALQIHNYVMGFDGYLFILLGFLGLVLHAEVNPGEFYRELQGEFRGSLVNTYEKVTSDIDSLR